MTDIGLIAILILVVLVLYGIGRGLRNRSRPLKIGVMSIVIGVVFLSLVFIGNAIGIGVYSFYQFESCPNSAPTCVTARQQEFNGRVPGLTLWMTVPKPFRPACETISPEFCVLETSYDFAPYGYFAGLVGLLIAVFIVLLGLRQKRVKLPDNSLPELDYGKH